MKMNPVLQQYITEIVLKTSIKIPSRFNLSPKSLRFATEQLTKVFPQRQDVQIRSLKIAGLQAEEIKPQAKTTQMILHIHGGAFFVGSLNTHRAFLSEMAVRTQMQVLQLEYPLAPEHPYPEASDAIYDTYQQLLAQGIQPKDIIVSGDSCGANLALALALRLKDEDPMQLPSALILMSPFLDLTLTSDSLRYNAKHDALLSIEALEKVGSGFLKLSEGSSGIETLYPRRSISFIPAENFSGASVELGAQIPIFPARGSGFSFFIFFGSDGNFMVLSD